jgi:hypothetical protein
MDATIEAQPSPVARREQDLPNTPDQAAGNMADLRSEMPARQFVKFYRSSAGSWNLAYAAPSPARAAAAATPAATAATPSSAATATTATSATSAAANNNSG